MPTLSTNEAIARRELRANLTAFRVIAEATLANETATREDRDEALRLAVQLLDAFAEYMTGVEQELVAGGVEARCF